MRIPPAIALCALVAAGLSARAEQPPGDSILSHAQSHVDNDVAADDHLLQASHQIAPFSGDDVVSNGAWRLFGTSPNGWTVNGWVAQGVTHNPDNPANPSGGFGNLPVGFNYRSDEFQLNQLYLSAEKRAHNCGCGWALGGRVDLLYGEDYIFLRATGLETDDAGRNLPGANRWNSGAGSGGIGGTARNGLAMPQVYAEVAYNDLSMKVGHFYSGMAYESAMAPQNFFYSHSYNFQYGVPITLTGALADWRYDDQFSFIGGLHNGWEVFDGPSDQIGFLAGVRWKSCDERTSLQFVGITGEDALGTAGAPPMVVGRDTLNAYNLTFSQQIGCRWQYVLEHVNGRQDRGSFEPGAVGVQDAEWYSFNQYLFYTINDCWRVGFRYEWFNADDGARVGNFGGQYQAATLGLNYSPHWNVTIRPEVRWDRFDPHNPATPLGPFSNLAERSQFLAALDLLVLF